MKEHFFITAWVAVIYFLLGMLGHTMAIPPGVATPIWPASGFALVVVLIFGRKAWLGIVIGAFLTTVEPLLLNADFMSITFLHTLLGFPIAIGILLQAIFGAWFIIHILDRDIFKSPNVFLKFSVGIFIICVVSSFIGTSVLYLTQSIASEKIIETWITWWMGDSVGVLLITPLMLSFLLNETEFKVTLSLIALYLLLILSTLFSFGFFFQDQYSMNGLIFLSWPILLIFALKYKSIHLSLATLIVSAIAIIFTYNMKGPFYLEDINASLLLLQIYIIVTYITTMSIVILSTQQQNTKRELMDENKERVKSELALSHLKDSLEIQVNEEIEKNRIKGLQLIQQSRLAQMGEMISMIAHQWRQPITVISMEANNILADIELDNIDKNTLGNSANNILDTTKKLSETIDDFRNFYKPNKQSVTIKLEDVINKTLNILKPVLINNNINIIKDCNFDEEIEIYESEIMHVILNIIRNSLDNFQEKKTDDPTIKIIIENRTILISDNGGGISEDIIEKIFDPYFSTKNQTNGTGLGLYMSQTIIEKHHNGSLLARNTDDGVCFKIIFGVISKK